jgi:hypothetical protein
MPKVAELIDRSLKGEPSKTVKAEVIALAREHPLP